MARRRRVRGDRSFRRILKRLPEVIKSEMLEMLDETGDAILAQQRQDVAVRTGALRAALSKRLYRGLVRVRVGLIGKPVNRRLFYAKWVESGRGAKTVQAKRRTGTRYTLRVGPMRARPFIRSKRTEQIRDTMAGKLKGYWQRVLTRASQGVSDE